MTGSRKINLNERVNVRYRQGDVGRLSSSGKGKKKAVRGTKAKRTVESGVALLVDQDRAERNIWCQKWNRSSER
jgi:hypothetical protein